MNRENGHRRIEEAFPILYEDEFLIAIDKPSGILVHRTRISEDTSFVLQRLRDQINQRIHPVHRLDRGTSGVLLLAKDSETASTLSEQFQHRTVRKSYLAIVRGYLPETGRIDYPLTGSVGKQPKEAVSEFRRLEQADYPVAIGRYPTSRFSLVEVRPQTGRFHQIRRHFSHLRHPVIGDKKHGDVKYNRYFRDQLGIKRMLLHANKLEIQHPRSGESLLLEVGVDEVFWQAAREVGLGEFFN